MHPHLGEVCPQGLDTFSTKADAELQKFAPVEQRYRDITKRMRTAFAREQSIYGGGQAANARSQVYFTIKQASFETNQVHMSMQITLQDFESKSGRLRQESTGGGQACHGAHLATATDPVPASQEAWNSACLGFLDVVKKFRQSALAVRGAFAHVETVWNEENNAQQEIVRVSKLATR
jgi:hypothetical protein